jgi:phosphatidylglycerophosphatase A
MKFITLPSPEEIQRLDFKNPALWVATWFGCGLMRPSPGTWGTLAGLPFAMILMALGGPIALMVGAALLFIVGLWAAKEFERMTGQHDSPMIVIDEVVGIILCLIPVSGAHPAYILLAFIAFRFFDILKPFPVSFFDQKFKNAYGVMLDDVMAAIYTIIVVMGVQYALSG